MTNVFNFPYTGYTKTETPKPTKKENLIALRDYLLENGMKESAAAVDNAIDVIAKELKHAEWVAEMEARSADAKDLDETNLGALGRG